jgi:general secretion pathway protein G
LLDNEGKVRGEGMIPFAKLRSYRGRLEAARASEAGFTLIEMLVVITIIGMIMALVGPRVLNYLGQSKVKAAKIQIESLASALDLYYLDEGRYPTTSDGLGALVQRTGNATAWNGPYLKGDIVPADPWGRPYVYRSPGEHGAYDIVSYGSDGQEGGTGTAGDITSWTR